MGITFVNKASAIEANSKTVVVSKPTNTTENDVMIAVISVEATTPTITPPTDWHLVYGGSIGGVGGLYQSVFYKAEGASEPSNYTFETESKYELIGVICSFRGMDTETPVGNYAQSTGTPGSTDTNAVSPTITTQRTNNWAMAIAGSRYGTTWTPPASSDTSEMQ